MTPARDDTGGKAVWFPAKRYGWGWGLPTCWQGWAVLAAYLVACGGAEAVLIIRHDRLAFYAIIAVSTALLLLTCWRKGERPRWRWGGD